MGGVIAFLALLMLMYRKGEGESHTPGVLPPAPAPAPSPGPSPSPTPHAVIPTPTPAQQVKNASTPVPWPAARPDGLPPWPSGWTPANPPPAAVVTRAWQLLPTLWAKGVGSQAVEKTGAEWITYVASYMNPTKTMKGVVAFRPKPGSMPATPKHQPTGNA